MRLANPLLLLLAVVLIGCHTAPETVAYRTSKTAHVTATAASEHVSNHRLIRYDIYLTQLH